MSFIRRLGSFWLILVLFGAGAYFSVNNPEWIDVHIPPVGALRVRAATALVSSFLLGCLVTVVYFCLDAARKSLLIRKKDRTISKLEKDLRMISPSSLSSEYLTAEETGSEADAMEPRFGQAPYIPR